MKHPISWRLVREIRDSATSKEMERAMFVRLRWHLDGIERWPGPYVHGSGDEGEEDR